MKYLPFTFYLLNRRARGFFEIPFDAKQNYALTLPYGKSLYSHICVNKKGLVRHVIIPRTLLDAHGPKEVSESKQNDLTTHRKIFNAPQSQCLHSLLRVIYL